MLLIMLLNLFQDNNSLLLWCHTTTPLFNLYEEALKKFLEFSSDDFNSLVAVESLKEFIIDDTGKPWNYMYGIWHKYSQELPILYKITGALFINKLSDIKETRYVINTKPYLMRLIQNTVLILTLNGNMNLRRCFIKNICINCMSLKKN